MRQWIVVCLVVFLCGCHVTGTIGGTSDLERSHTVNVAINFAGE